jgi:phosphatidylglycerol lysyltransferase
MEIPAGCEYYPSQDVMPSEAVALLERFAFGLGQTYDSYLATENDREYFWSAERRGVIGFRRWHRYVHVLGGLLTTAEHRETLLADFLEFVDANRLTATFYSLGRDELPLFRQHGFQMNKCAEELIVRLDRTSWNGKAYQWLRRQENYCVRQGVRVEEVRPDPADPVFRDHVIPELDDINRAHLARTVHGRELEFFEGRFQPLALKRRRLFVARQESRIVAFLVCNPGLGGDLWAIEVYRRRPDAPRGVIPFSMLHVMRELQSEGVPYVSLSPVAFLRCGPPIKNDSLVLQFIFDFWWRRMNWLFDVRGLYHFKSRFRPYYRELFLATYPRITCKSMFAMAAIWKLFHVNPVRLFGHLMRYHARAGKRRTLSRPQWRPERKIRGMRREAGSHEPAAQPGSEITCPEPTFSHIVANQERPQEGLERV